MSEQKKEKKGLQISAKTFLAAIAVIFALMVLTYALTLVVPGGLYFRTQDAAGNVIIDEEVGFQAIPGGLPFWKWLLSPFLVLGAAGNITLIAVIAFLLIIGGVFNALEKSGLMRYMLDKIVFRCGSRRYTLLALVTLFFMSMGALIGSFEEVVPLVPIVATLAVSLGWDTLTGLGMSLLAVGCGFASGVCNPFTVGIAQRMAGLPMFSGLWFRLLGFVLIYALLSLFLRGHAKKVEKPLDLAAISQSFQKNEKLEKAILIFALSIGIGIVLVLSSAGLTFLQDYTLFIIAGAFLVGGLWSPLRAGMTGKQLAVTFRDGLVSMLPAVLMILMASSIRYTLEEGKILDSILHAAVEAAQTMPKAALILFIYLIVLVMNFFIGSGSAKAFLMMPLIVPMAQIFGLPAQLCVLAFAFGDGFSNVFYPTNAALLIGLGLSNVGYTDWVKWSWKFQALNLLLTGALLLVGLAIGYC